MDESHNTLISQLEKIASKNPDQIIIQIKENDEYKHYTYSDFLNKAKEIASQLIEAGTKPQDRIAIALENRPEWGMIYFGILIAGATAVPIDPQSHQEDLEYFINHSTAKILFLSKSLHTKYATSLVTNTPLQTIFTLPANLHSPYTTLERTVPQGADSEVFDETKAQEEGRRRAISSNTSESAPCGTHSQLASILYTSGTTGKPKGVMLTHANFYANFNSMRQLNLFTQDNNVLAILPLHHSFPFMTTFLIPLLSGIRVTYLSELSSDAILQCMQETNITVLVGVPQIYTIFYNRILNHIQKMTFILRWSLKGVIEINGFLRKYLHLNFSKFVFFRTHRLFGKKLRFFVCGGAKLDPTIHRFLSKLGFTLIEGYGLTETAPIVTLNPLKQWKIGSVGKPIPDVEVKIDHPDAQGIGEIIIKGPNVMAGYYNNPTATDAVIQSGWFYSGDLGYLDASNYLYITGRKKEIIVLSTGKNISPEEVETYYAKSPYIKELCVVAMGDQTEDKLMAVIVPNMEYFKKAGEINVLGMMRWDLDNLSKSYPPYKRIMGFTISTEELPRTRLGKLKRFLIKEQFHDALLGTHVEKPSTEISYSEEDLRILSSALWKQLLQIIQNLKQTGQPPSLDQHLEIDLGVDSLTRAELVVALEKQFSIKISVEAIAQVYTVRELFFVLETEVSKTNSAAKALHITSSEHELWHEILNKNPSQPVLDKIELQPNRFLKLCAIIVCKSMWLVFKLFWRLKIKGLENLPKDQSFILCPNHTSYFDAFLIAASAPNWLIQKLFFIGYSAYFDKPIIRNLVKAGRLIAIDSGVHLIDAMQVSAYVLKHDKVINIFPEGVRSIDGQLQPLKSGVGILAHELNISLLPVHIQGAFKAWPRGQKLPRLHAITVTFGKRYTPEALKEKGSQLKVKNEYAAITQGLAVVMQENG